MEEEKKGIISYKIFIGWGTFFKVMGWLAGIIIPIAGFIIAGNGYDYEVYGWVGIILGISSVISGYFWNSLMLGAASIVKSLNE
jgi:hypothetical protein